MIFLFLSGQPTPEWATTRLQGRLGVVVARLALSRTAPGTPFGLTELANHHGRLGRLLRDAPTDQWREGQVQLVLLHGQETGNKVYVSV